MIYFVRHGQTDLNKQHVFQGSIDEPLNELGMLQAIEVATKLKNEKIDVIYSSPLKRAYTTAEAVNKFHNVEILKDKRISELNLGKLEGQHYDKESLEKLIKSSKEYGGEGVEDLIKRVKKFLQDIENQKGKNILVVAHGGVYKAMYFCLTGEKTEVNINNCEVAKFEF